MLNLESLIAVIQRYSYTARLTIVPGLGGLIIDASALQPYSLSKHSAWVGVLDYGGSALQLYSSFNLNAWVGRVD